MSRATSAGDGRCGLAARLAATRCASIASCARRCRWSDRPRSRGRPPAGLREPATMANRGVTSSDGSSSRPTVAGEAVAPVVIGAERSHRPCARADFCASPGPGIGSISDGTSALTDIRTTSLQLRFTFVYFRLLRFAYGNAQLGRSAVVHSGGLAGSQVDFDQANGRDASATPAAWLPAPETHAFSTSATVSTPTLRAAVLGAGLRGSPASATFSARGPVRTVAVQPAFSASAAYRRAARPRLRAEGDASTTPNAIAQMAGDSRSVGTAMARARSTRQARSTTAPAPGGRAARGSPRPASATTACADPPEGHSQVSTAPGPGSHRARLAPKESRGATPPCNPRRPARRR